MNLMTGALGSYNPDSHRRVALAPAEAREMIILALHLLNVVESRKSRRWGYKFSARNGKSNEVVGYRKNLTRECAPDSRGLGASYSVRRAVMANVASLADGFRNQSRRAKAPGNQWAASGIECR
jgi:hypothetical protein